VSRRRGRAAAASLAVAVSLAVTACGGGSAGSGGSAPRTSSVSVPGTTTTSPAPASTTHARHRRRPAPPAPVSGPPVGVRQAVRTGGAELTVTILRVVRLRDTGSPALPGTRQVGVQLRIANQAGATYDSTSSGDVSVVVSRGASEPLDVRRGTCETPLVDFESFVTAGSVRTGCVAFSVPRAARVIGVRFSPHSRAPGTLSWRVRGG
jgi:hypothetical protein